MFRKFHPFYDDQSTPGGATSDSGENNTPSTPSTPEVGASEQGSEGAASTTPSGINVGGREYTTQELEQKLKSLEELNKGYTQSRQELAELKRRDEEAKKLYGVAETTSDPLAGLDEEQKRQFQEAAKYMTPYMKEAIRAEADELFKARFAETSQQKEFESKFQNQVKEVQDLAGKWNVKFDENSVSALTKYMQETGSTNVVSAFKEINQTAMIDYEIAQRKHGQKKIYTESGGKVPSTPNKPVYSGVNDPKFRADMVAKMAAMMD